MRKYWYYTCASGYGLWSEVCYSDSGKFDLEQRLKILNNKYRRATIISWHEISTNEYEKLRDYFENKNK